MEGNYIEEIMAKISCYIKDGNSERNKPNYNEVWELIQNWHEVKIKQLEGKVRIYDIQVWAAMQAKSFGLCKKCLSHAINDIRKLEGKDG
jgi:hypothetical protein